MTKLEALTDLLEEAAKHQMTPEEIVAHSVARNQLKTHLPPD